MSSGVTRTRTNTNPNGTKPVLRAEVYARALRASQNRKEEEGWECIELSVGC